MAMVTSAQMSGEKPQGAPPGPHTPGKYKIVFELLSLRVTGSQVADNPSRLSVDMVTSPAPGDRQASRVSQDWQGPQVPSDRPACPSQADSGIPQQGSPTRGFSIQSASMECQLGVVGDKPVLDKVKSSGVEQSDQRLSGWVLGCVQSQGHRGRSRGQTRATFLMHEQHTTFCCCYRCCCCCCRLHC